MNSGTLGKNSISSTKTFREIAETSTNSPAIPDGWVMVPKTATPEISLAINKVGQQCTCGNCSQRLWDMLLEAAQKKETRSCTK